MSIYSNYNFVNFVNNVNCSWLVMRWELDRPSLCEVILLLLAQWSPVTSDDNLWNLLALLVNSTCHSNVMMTPGSCLYQHIVMCHHCTMNIHPWFAMTDIVTNKLGRPTLYHNYCQARRLLPLLVQSGQCQNSKNAFEINVSNLRLKI